MDRAASSANPASATGPKAPCPTSSARAGYFRWVICALLLFGTTKNYMDRQVLGILKGPLQHDLGWNEIDFGNLVLAFQAFYAIGMVVVGRVIDRLGTRLGYALSMVFLEPGFNGPRIVQFIHRLYCGPLGARPRRVRRLSRQH